jgi:hypothetical protein
MLAPAYHLLLCGDAADWAATELSTMRERFGDLIAVHRLTRKAEPGVLLDPTGEALTRLHADKPIHYLVRPDGHIGYRNSGTNLHGAVGHLTRWLPRVSHR